MRDPRYGRAIAFAFAVLLTATITEADTLRLRNISVEFNTFQGHGIPYVYLTAGITNDGPGLATVARIDANGSAPTSFFQLQPGDLIVNVTGTSARLRLPDGTNLVWTSTGAWTSLSDVEQRDTRHGQVTLSSRRVVNVDAFVTGTLTGVAVDTRTIPGVTVGTQQNVIHRVWERFRD